MTLRGSSREALQTVRSALDAVADASGNPVGLADELFAVVDLLDAQPALRRTLSDPSRPADARAGLVRSLLSSQLGGATLDLLDTAVRQRWSQPRDLADALDTAAVETLGLAAEREGVLDDVEDEVFRFGRVVAGEPALRAALTDRVLPADRKESVLDELLAGRATDVTRRLVRRAVLAPRGRSLESILDGYGKALAGRRQRLVAVARVAVPLTEEQRRRLTAALETTYGRGVHLNVELDPSVLGGVEVRVGDEVVDGTVADRLAEARRRLAG